MFRHGIYEISSALFSARVDVLQIYDFWEVLVTVHGVVLQGNFVSILALICFRIRSRDEVPLDKNETNPMIGAR